MNRLVVSISPCNGTVSSDVGGIVCSTNPAVLSVCVSQFGTPTTVTLFISADDSFVVNNLYDNDTPVTLSCGSVGNTTGPQCEASVFVDGEHAVEAEIVTDLPSQ